MPAPRRRLSAWSGLALTASSPASMCWTFAASRGHRLRRTKQLSPRSSMPAQLGIFELSWDVLCPTCRGVLDVTTTLQDVHNEPYDCALCGRSFEANARRAGGDRLHREPARAQDRRARPRHRLPLWDYYRHVLTGAQPSTSPTDGRRQAEHRLHARTRASSNPGEARHRRTSQVAEGWVLIFDPVSHFGHYLKVAPERAADFAQRVALAFEGARAPTDDDTPALRDRWS